MVVLRGFTQNVSHCVTNAIAEILADDAYLIQPRDQFVAAAGRQGIRNNDSLLEHIKQRFEVAFIVIAKIATKAGCTLAVENRQFRQSGWISYRLPIVNNGLFTFGSGNIKDARRAARVRRYRSLDRLLVRFQDVLA